MSMLRAAWSTAFRPQAAFPLPTLTTVEALHEALFAPYRRLRTVSFEALDWQTCFKRYDRPGALQIVDPDFHDVEPEEVLHLLRASLCSWALRIPLEMEGQFREIAEAPNVPPYEGSERTFWLISASSSRSSIH